MLKKFKMLSLGALLLCAILMAYGCGSSDSGGSSKDNTWSWIFPQPQGCDLHTVWSASATSTYAVGMAGTIMHYDGTGWTLMENPETTSLFSLWGASDTCVYAGGSHDGILKWDGETWSWSKKENKETDQVFKTVFGFSENDVYAGSGTGLFHFDGSGWSLLEGTPFGDGDITAMWGTSGNDLHVAYVDKIWHYDGTGWTQLYDVYDPTAILTSIWGTSGNDIYCTARRTLISTIPTLYHFDGTKWDEVPEEGDLNNAISLCGVWGTGPDNIYVTGMESVLIHWDGQTWKQIQGGAVLWLFGISGVSDDLFFMVGETGVIYEYKNGEMNFPRTDFFTYLLDVYVNQQEKLYALGVHDLYTLGEKMPEEIYLPDFDYPVDLAGITGAGEEMFLAGNYETDAGDSKGIVYKYDGSEWSILSTEIGGGRFSSIWTDGSVLLTAAQTGQIYSYADGAWEEMVLPVEVSWSRIWGTSQSNLYAVGAKGTVLKYDGTTWSQMDAGAGSYTLKDIWTSGPEDVYVVGDMGAARHFDGSSWTDVDLGKTGAASETIGCVCGRSPSQILFYDGGGTIYTYNGKEVVSSQDITNYLLTRMVNAGDGGDIYAVGNMGMILKNSVK